MLLGVTIKTVVLVLSCQSIEPVHKMIRISHQAKNKISIECPAAIYHLNKSIGGVDLRDTHDCRFDERASVGKSGAF